MKNFTYTITDESGIHARPAGLLVKEAEKFSSKITIKGNGKSADLKRLLSVMGLSIKKGVSVEVIAEGDDEVKAAAAIEAFLKQNL